MHGCVTWMHTDVSVLSCLLKSGMHTQQLAFMHWCHMLM